MIKRKDIIKIAMINIYNKLDEGGFKTKMLLQVHDELVFDALKTEVPQLKILIKEAMENVFESKVPLTIAIGEGATWLEAH